MVTSRMFDYAPPDTGVSDLQLVALERLPSIEGAGQICWSAPFRGEFFICTHPMPSPMRGRRHGEAVTDEVGHFRLRAAVHLISRLRRQLPLIGEAIGVRSPRPPLPGEVARRSRDGEVAANMQQPLSHLR